MKKLGLAILMALVCGSSLSLSPQVAHANETHFIYFQNEERDQKENLALVKVEEEKQMLLKELQALGSMTEPQLVEHFKSLLVQTTTGSKEDREFHASEVYALLLNLEAEQIRREALVSQKEGLSKKNHREFEKSIFSIVHVMSAAMIGMFLPATLPVLAPITYALAARAFLYQPVKSIAAGFREKKVQELLEEIPDVEPLFLAFDKAYSDVMGHAIESGSRSQELDDHFQNQKYLSCGEIVKAE